MILTVAHLWITGLWLAFLVIWIIAAIFAKRSRDPGSIRRGVAGRAIIAVAIIASYELAKRSAQLVALQFAELRNVPLAVSGAVLVTLGAALAFSARAAIGRNWGTPGSRKTDTELVTSGPYSLVRHPIYSGILLMMIGTAIGMMPIWLIIAPLAATYMIINARAEERYMTERFPGDYPAYRARTKMLIPFVL
jgi:protein-S-isoprenylcysteine O-methyltransferase Ste14